MDRHEGRHGLLDRLVRPPCVCAFILAPLLPLFRSGSPAPLMRILQSRYLRDASLWERTLEACFRQRATNSFNSGLNITQGLPGLLSQICSADDLPLCVPGSLTRNVDCLAAIGDDDLRKTVLQTSEKRIRIYVFFRHGIQKIPGLYSGGLTRTRSTTPNAFGVRLHYLVRVDCMLCAC